MEKNISQNKSMELTEVSFDELLVTRHYLVVTYRGDSACMYQIHDGQGIGYNREYFVDGKDYNGNNLTYKFFCLPTKIR